MVEVHKYHLHSTALIPNSPRPVLHYPGLLPVIETGAAPHCDPVELHQTFVRNGWRTEWIFRYGATQTSHYHSRVHECMAVLTGGATIRFGVADAEYDDDSNSSHTGVEVHARAGDVFVLPAGIAHKTFATVPETEFALLTPGDGHEVATDDDADVAATLDRVELSGFTMMGAYPVGSGQWDFQEGGEDVGRFEAVWDVAKPERDPVLGSDSAGLVALW